MAEPGSARAQPDGRMSSARREGGGSRGNHGFPRVNTGPVPLRDEA